MGTGRYCYRERKTWSSKQILSSGQVHDLIAYLPFVGGVVNWSQFPHEKTACPERVQGFMLLPIVAHADSGKTSPPTAELIDRDPGAYFQDIAALDEKQGARHRPPSGAHGIGG
jgi:hypothetical protein